MRERAAPGPKQNPQTSRFRLPMRQTRRPAHTIPIANPAPPHVNRKSLEPCKRRQGIRCGASPQGRSRPRDCKRRADAHQPLGRKPGKAGGPRRPASQETGQANATRTAVGQDGEGVER